MTDPIDVPKPPPIDAWTVDGAAGLPDDVKNGEIEHPEDDPNVIDEPPTEENA